MNASKHKTARAHVTLGRYLVLIAVFFFNDECEVVT